VNALDITPDKQLIAAAGKELLSCICNYLILM